MGKAPSHCLNRIDRIDATTNLISGICRRSCFRYFGVCNQTRWHPQMWSLAAAAATTTQLRQSLSISVIFSQWFADGHVIGARRAGDGRDRVTLPAGDEGRVPFGERNPSPGGIFNYCVNSGRWFWKVPHHISRGCQFSESRTLASSFPRPQLRAIQGSTKPFFLLSQTGVSHELSELYVELMMTNWAHSRY